MDVWRRGLRTIQYTSNAVYRHVSQGYSSTSVYYTEHIPINKKQGRSGNEANGRVAKTGKAWENLSLKQGFDVLNFLSNLIQKQYPMEQTCRYVIAAWNCPRRRLWRKRNRLHDLLGCKLFMCYCNACIACMGTLEHNYF